MCPSSQLSRVQHWPSSASLRSSKKPAPAITDGNCHLQRGRFDIKPDRIEQKIHNLELEVGCLKASKSYHDPSTSDTFLKSVVIYQSKQILPNCTQRSRQTPHHQFELRSALPNTNLGKPTLDSRTTQIFRLCQRMQALDSECFALLRRSRRNVSSTHET